MSDIAECVALDSKWCKEEVAKLRQHIEALRKIADAATKVREMFDAQAPNELLVAHDLLADALDDSHYKPTEGSQ